MKTTQQDQISGVAPAQAGATSRPKGTGSVERPADLVAWAKEILDIYGPMVEPS